MSQLQYLLSSYYVPSTMHVYSWECLYEGRAVGNRRKAFPNMYVPNKNENLTDCKPAG